MENQGVAYTTYTWPASNLHCRAAIFCQFRSRKGAASAEGVALQPKRPNNSAGCPHHGAVWRFHHHRPYLARWLHQGQLARSTSGWWQRLCKRPTSTATARAAATTIVMVRGTFNVRIKNLMIAPTADGSREEGARHGVPERGPLQGQKMFILTRPCNTWQETPTVVFARGIRTGSSRDWPPRARSCGHQGRGGAQL